MRKRWTTSQNRRVHRIIVRWQGNERFRILLHRILLRAHSLCTTLKEEAIHPAKRVSSGIEPRSSQSMLIWKPDLFPFLTKWCFAVIIVGVRIETPSRISQSHLYEWSEWMMDRPWLKSSMLYTACRSILCFRSWEVDFLDRESSSPFMSLQFLFSGPTTRQCSRSRELSAWRLYLSFHPYHCQLERIEKEDPQAPTYRRCK